MQRWLSGEPGFDAKKLTLIMKQSTGCSDLMSFQHVSKRGNFPEQHSENFLFFNSMAFYGISEAEHKGNEQTNS